MLPKISPKTWYVLYTKPNNEKKTAYRLQQIGLTVYCPEIEVIKQWSDRKKKIQKPLLPSYIFVQLEESKRDQVFQVAGVVRYLYWLGKPAVVRDEEIEALKKWLTTSYQKIELNRFKLGCRITLEEGIFKGNVAIVKEHRGKKVQLILESLGIIVIMEVAE